MFQFWPNVLAMYGTHFAVPMEGAVLNTINTRLNCNNLATNLKHSEAKLLFDDYEYVGLAREALKLLIADVDATQLPSIMVIDDVNAPTGTRLGKVDEERLVSGGKQFHELPELADEWDPLALNDTSATSRVVYSHRGVPIH
ncbi:hypothetical protein BHM03_00028917 [Ensete ventricosum]|uniref:AMP-dependent synthetase/ligase domain-containing protein n=1 Tax=Ensete ventricosum TaxID=4639 RepID=A0A445MI13_ENSVE|nr:hypothetical protein BHM03_00028917 [Ensete ventricosum]